MEFMTQFVRNGCTGVLVPLMIGLGTVLKDCEKNVDAYANRKIQQVSAEQMAERARLGKLRYYHPPADSQIHPRIKPSS